MEFKEITIEDKMLFDKYVFNKNYQGCEYSFATNYIWRHRYKREIAVKDDILFIRSIFNEVCTYFFPICNAPYEHAFEILQQFRCLKNGTLVVVGVTAREKDSFPNPENFSFNSNESASDYIYNTADLINLEGKKYHGKRGHISKFKKLYGEINYEDITQDNIAEIAVLDNFWREETDNQDSPEKRAVKSALANFDELGLIGGALRVDGKIIAFTMGSPISNETFDINIEKADRTFEGAYAVINNEFAKRRLSSYRYINREEDMGIEGLRKAKLSYYPEIILKNIFASWKSDEVSMRQ